MVSNVLPTWKQRRSKQSFVRIPHTSCGAALPDTQGVGPGRFLTAREIGKAVHQMLQLVVDGPGLPSNALAR